MAGAVLVPIIDALIPEIPIIEQAIASMLHRGAPAASVIAQLQTSYNNVATLDADTMATLAKLMPAPSAGSTTATALASTKPSSGAGTVGVSIG
jgi:hypothetical protein